MKNHLKCISGNLLSKARHQTNAIKRNLFIVGVSAILLTLATTGSASVLNSFYRNLDLSAASNYTNGVPNNTHDVQITTTSGTALDISGGNMVMESLTVKNGRTYSIGNMTSFPLDRTLTLGKPLGFKNAQNGGTNDLIVVSGTGSDLSILGPNQGSGTGRLLLALASSGNFNVGSNLSLFISSPISGATFGFTNVGPGTVILSASNTFSGNVSLDAGTLLLAGSISSTPKISIAAGATFDVSFTGFAFRGSGPQQTLAAKSGSGSASINATGKTVTLNSGALLSFQAVGVAIINIGKISVSGNLTLNSNTVSINSANSAIKPGTYRLLDCTGTLTGSANPTPTITGVPLSSGTAAMISTVTGSAGHVDLIVRPIPVFSGLTNASVAFSASGPNFTGKLSAPGSLYPAMGETVKVTIAGHVQTTTINDSTGDFLIHYDSSVLFASSNAYVVTYSYDGNSSLASATDATTTLTVNKAPVSFALSHPNNNNKVYDGTTAIPFVGSATPVGVNNLSVFVFDDPAHPITESVATPSVETNKQITLGGFYFTPAADANYYFVQPNNVFGSILPAPLSITASNESKTYGQVLTHGAGSTAFTAGGLENGESVGSVTLVASGGEAATDAVGSYAVVPSAATGGTFDPNNYAITYNNGTLTVSPAALTITALDAYKNLGDTLTFVGTEFTNTDLQNGETIGSVTLSSTGAVAEATAGDYPIVPDTATGGTFNPTNYSIFYTNGTLHVYLFTTNAILTVTTISNTPVQVAIADVLAKTTGGQGTLVLDSADGASHGTLTVDATNITYTPEQDYLGEDSFNCVVKDGNGLSTIIAALVTITETNQSNLVQQSTANNLPNLAIQPDGSGGISLKIMGTPGATYLLKYSADLRTWDAFPDFPAFKMPDSGVTNYNDLSPVSPRYYQAVPQ